MSSSNALVEDHTPYDPPQKIWGMTNIRTVKLTIGFIGTRYEGWQSQRKNSTVQEILESHLRQILKEKTDLIASSRTDSGVHALALAAHFRTKSHLPDQKIKQALNFYLPKDILVHSARTMREDFHARYHAKSKIYRYEIWNRPTRPLFEACCTLWHPYPLKVEPMKRAASYIRGRHDFTAFYDKGDEKKSFIRTVKRLTVQKEKGVIRIEIEADGFLRHMVRVIVGTLIEAGRGKIQPQAIPQILLSKDRSKAGPTAKAHGLTLIRVKY